MCLLSCQAGVQRNRIIVCLNALTGFDRLCIPGFRKGSLGLTISSACTESRRE